LIQTFTLKAKFLVLLLGIFVSLMLFNTDDFNNLPLYGHLFTPNETATFVGILDQVQAELELVVTNLENDNVSLAQTHVIKAASLLTPKIMIEITEDNPRLTSDLRRAVSQLQNMSSPSESQLKSVSHLVNDLNNRMDQDAIVRIAQLQPTSSNFLEGALKSLGSIFGGSNTNEEQDQDIKLQALAFANVIDGMLINYGKAYRVGFDMTNMSNMVMIGNNSSPSSMVMSNPVTGNNSGASNMNMNMNMNMNSNSMNSSSNNMTGHAGEMNAGYSLVNVSDYQSAQALATKAFEVFSAKLKHTTMTNNKNVTGFVTNLENGLTQLNDSITNKASPLDVMMIVHTKIHPNLLEAFNLQLRK
jgi:DNA-directed RNA polymerase subunit F